MNESVIDARTRRVPGYSLVESIRLLSKAELLALFPEACLFQERLMGLTKSFVVYAGWS